MSEHPGFCVLLGRLLDHRKLDVRDLSGTYNEQCELRAADRPASN
jgi:hypothetical protein